MKSFFRKKVSGAKKRLVDEKYDLDLSYITPKIIAMAFPASGFEKLYRNSIDEVAKFIREKHRGHFKIVNLANRKYDYSKFENQVEEYEWIDHHAPPLGILFKICKNMKEFMDKDPQNVAIINCQAGKGRTGTVICCLLLYSGVFEKVKDAFDYYSVKRFSKGQGVTQPSQKRYVHYFYTVLRESYYFPKIIDITGIYLFKPKPIYMDNLKPFLKFYQKNSDVLDYSNKSGFLEQKKIMCFDNKPIQITDNEFTHQVIGDITIKIYNNEFLKNQVIGRISFNTSFLKENEQTLYFNLPEIDPDNLRKDHEIPKDFQIIVKYKEKKLCDHDDCKWPDLCGQCKFVLESEINEYTHTLAVTENWRREILIGDPDKTKGLFMLFGNNPNDIEDTIGRPLNTDENPEEDVNYLSLLNKAEEEDQKEDDKDDNKDDKKEGKEDEPDFEGNEPEDVNTSGGCSII